MPTSIPPDPVTGFCILPRADDDLEHLGANRVAVARVLLAQLAEGGGVEVERVDVDQHLVRPDLGVGVEHRRGLGQRPPRRVHDTVQAEG